MQASQDESDLCPPTSPSPQAEGLSADSGVRLDVFKPGWAQAVGWGLIAEKLDLVQQNEFAYSRLVLKDFHLSHAAALFLLQGASLKTLFGDVVVRIDEIEPEVFSLAVSESPRLFTPPPFIRRVVLAHILERPVTITPDVLFERIFMLEMARSSF